MHVPVQVDECLASVTCFENHQTDPVPCSFLLVNLIVLYQTMICVLFISAMHGGSNMHLLLMCPPLTETGY